jgi:hypothetical protein
MGKRVISQRQQYNDDRGQPTVLQQLPPLTCLAISQVEVFNQLLDAVSLVETRGPKLAGEAQRGVSAHSRPPSPAMLHGGVHPSWRPAGVSWRALTIVHWSRRQH